jgi:signal transduction histidine kinase
MNARVPLRHTGDEVDELAGQFNALLDTIESLVTRMRSALDDIAHELRTPMTRLRGAAEMALRSTPDTETYKHALADCLEEAEQTLTTLNALMDVAEAEAGAMKLDREEVDLPALLGSVAGLYEHVAEEKGITLRTAVADGLRLTADPRRLRQAVANLVDNAIKYTPRGGEIEISARGEQQQVSVKDTGMGVRAEELPRIWDRLYRGGGSGSERGLGLGLSLVRAVVQAHQGSVEAASEPGKGSQFVLRLPAGRAGQGF